MPHQQTGQKGSAGLLQCPRILLTCFIARMSAQTLTHFAVVSPDDVRLSGGAAGDDAGEVEGGALAQENLARTEDRRFGS